jgi:hypothetical protein
MIWDVHSSIPLPGPLFSIDHTYDRYARKRTIVRSVQHGASPYMTINEDSKKLHINALSGWLIELWIIRRDFQGLKNDSEDEFELTMS